MHDTFEKEFDMEKVFLNTLVANQDIASVAHFAVLAFAFLKKFKRPRSCLSWIFVVAQKHASTDQDIMSYHDELKVEIDKYIVESGNAPDDPDDAITVRVGGAGSGGGTAVAERSAVFMKFLQEEVGLGSIDSSKLVSRILAETTYDSLAAMKKEFDKNETQFKANPVFSDLSQEDIGFLWDSIKVSKS